MKSKLKVISAKPVSRLDVFIYRCFTDKKTGIIKTESVLFIKGKINFIKLNFLIFFLGCVLLMLTLYKSTPNMYGSKPQNSKVSSKFSF